VPRLAPPPPDFATLDEGLERWARSMRADNKAPKTIETYLYAGDHLARQVGRQARLDRITRTDHERLIDGLLDRMAPATVSTIYRSLHSFWRFAVEHRELAVAHDPMDGMRPPTVPEVAVEFVTDEELRAILKTCHSKSRHNFLGHRDEAIVRLFATTAARLSEVATLTLGDVDLMGATVRVMGKGRRERYLPMDDATLTAVKRYLDRERPRHPAARGTDLVWLARAGAMTGNGIGQMIAQRGWKALGADHRRVHPHELRHRQIATLLGAGLSEGDVMAISGHRSRSMMDRYGAWTKSKRAHDAFRRSTAAGALPKL
jgi:site-specific recombinase XerD